MSTEVFVYSMLKRGGAWGRYVFPFDIETFAQLGNDLYIKHGNKISKVDATTSTDDYLGVATLVPGVVQWPWLDCGTPGVNKMMEGVDIIATNYPALRVGYDQANVSRFTSAFYPYDPSTPTGDSLEGTMTPLPVTAPSFSIKVTFDVVGVWKLVAVNMVVHDTQMGV